MFHPALMLSRKRIKAPGRSGNSKRYRISFSAAGAWPPTRWRTCSFAISLSGRAKRASIQDLVRGRRRGAADQVAHVQLRHLVVGEVERLDAVLVERGEELFG